MIQQQRPKTQGSFFSSIPFFLLVSFVLVGRGDRKKGKNSHTLQSAIFHTLLRVRYARGLLLLSLVHHQRLCTLSPSLTPTLQHPSRLITTILHGVESFHLDFFSLSLSLSTHWVLLDARIYLHTLFFFDASRCSSSLYHLMNPNTARVSIGRGKKRRRNREYKEKRGKKNQSIAISVDMYAFISTPSIGDRESTAACSE